MRNTDSIGRRSRPSDSDRQQCRRSPKERGTRPTSGAATKNSPSRYAPATIRVSNSTCFLSATGKTGPIIKINYLKFTVGRYHTITSVNGDIQNLGCHIAIFLKFFFIKGNSFGHAIDFLQTEFAVRTRRRIKPIKEIRSLNAIKFN